MKSDAQLEKDVEAELEWDPSVNATQVGVEVVEVQPTADNKRGDADLAHAVEAAFAWHRSVPADRIQARVSKGWVTLSGEVDWEYQRAAAANLVRPLAGVVGVNNGIVLKPRTTPAHIGKRIRDALTRQAEREAKGIEVQVHGATAVLRGSVHSLAERVAAQGAARSAPGITRVDNELRIGP